MSTCNHDSVAPDQTLDALHLGQEGTQRHKCTECAYGRGYNLGQTREIIPTGNAECTYTGLRAPHEIIEALPESQAGIGRHKCAVCAFHEGFARGRAIAAHAS